MGIATELVKFRKELVQPKKDGDNPQFRNSYVTHDAVIKAIDDALIKSGANLTYIQGIEDGVIYTDLMSDDEKMRVPGAPVIEVQMVKGKGWVEAHSPQAYGSGITYAKRYSISLVFGIAADVDDDGQAAQEAQNQRNNNQPNHSQPKQNNAQQPFSGIPERKVNLNSQFGALRKRIMDMHNLDDEQEVFDQINNNFELNIASFSDFAGLEEGMKQQIVNLMQGWTNN